MKTAKPKIAIVVGTSPKDIVDSVSVMLNKEWGEDNPFGDEFLVKKIVKILE